MPLQLHDFQIESCVFCCVEKGGEISRSKIIDIIIIRTGVLLILWPIRLSLWRGSPFHVQSNKNMQSWRKRTLLPIRRVVFLSRFSFVHFQITHFVPKAVFGPKPSLFLIERGTAYHTANRYPPPRTSNGFLMVDTSALGSTYLWKSFLFVFRFRCHRLWWLLLHSGFANPNDGPFLLGKRPWDCELD